MVAPVKPPRPPDQVLRRVLAVSRLNGWSVALFAGVCALGALPFGDLVSFAVGALVTVGGIMEIRGNHQLRRRDPDGMRLLVRSQLFVLGVIWVYAVPRLLSFDAAYLQDQVIPGLRDNLAAAGMNLDEVLQEVGLDQKQIVPMVHLAFVVLYSTVMLATLIYQGGLALFYRHRTAAVEAALRAPPPVAAAAPAAPEFPAADQRYYDQVAAELARQDLQPGLWARALAEAGANDARAQAFYIRLRVAQLRQEQGARPS